MTTATGCKEKRKDKEYGGEQMKRYLTIMSFLAIVLMMTPGLAQAEEAGCYQAADNWIIRVCSEGTGPYTLSLVVLDTSGAVVPKDNIMAFTALSNPYIFETAANKPDLSLGCDTAGTAYIFHDSGGQLTLTSISDIVSVPTGTPVLQTSTALINFGTVKTGTTKNSTVTVTNAGTAPLHITSVTAPAAPFAKISDTCNGATVAPSGICSIGIRFAPTAAKIYTSSFGITSDGGNATITLQGAGSSGGGGI